MPNAHLIFYSNRVPLKLNTSLWWAIDPFNHLHFDRSKGYEGLFECLAGELGCDMKTSVPPFAELKQGSTLFAHNALTWWWISSLRQNLIWCLPSRQAVARVRASVSEKKKDPFYFKVMRVDPQYFNTHYLLPHIAFGWVNHIASLPTQREEWQKVTKS